MEVKGIKYVKVRKQPPPNFNLTPPRVFLTRDANARFTAAEKDGSGNFTNKVITLWYRPPELLFGSTRYSFHVDMWSAGCIFAELQCGRPILPGKGEIEQLQLIFDLVGTPNDAAMKAYKDTRGNGKVVDVDLRNERKSKLREKFCKKMSKVRNCEERIATSRECGIRASNHFMCILY